MDRERLADLGQPQQERLYFVDFCLYFLGGIGRQDHAERFAVAPAVFTRDLASYRNFAPDNLTFNEKVKRYETTSSFRPLFEHDVARVLIALTQGYGEGLYRATRGYLPSVLPTPLGLPTAHVLAAICRAIHLRKAVKVNYVSYSSGASKHDLVPHSLLDSGRGWKVRAFDRKTKLFKDFGISSITKPNVSDDPVQLNETLENDHQWSRMVRIELVAHPKLRQDVAQLDCAMNNETLTMNIRASCIGYILRYWNVDCTQEATLDPKRYQFWLPEAERVLYDIESAKLVHGWQK